LTHLPFSPLLSPSLRSRPLSAPPSFLTPTAHLHALSRLFFGVGRFNFSSKESPAIPPFSLPVVFSYSPCLRSAARFVRRLRLPNSFRSNSSLPWCVTPSVTDKPLKNVKSPPLPSRAAASRTIANMHGFLKVRPFCKGQSKTPPTPPPPEGRLLQRHAPPCERPCFFQPLSLEVIYF